MGKVLIVQNQEYVDCRRHKYVDMKEEKEVEEDVKVNEMKETFKKMGFTDKCIEEHKNKTKSEIIQLLKDGKYILIYR